jgi:hypothetical protein
VKSTWVVKKVAVAIRSVLFLGVQASVAASSVPPTQ